jgi:hypothetical protein
VVNGQTSWEAIVEPDGMLKLFGVRLALADTPLVRG